MKNIGMKRNFYSLIKFQSMYGTEIPVKKLV